MVSGHKTGFYLDQRDNRLLTRALAAGRSGAELLLLHRRFLAAGTGRWRQPAFDRFPPGRRWPRLRNLARNLQLDATRAEWREADVFDALRAFLQGGPQFDLIVPDPPKFAPRRRIAQLRAPTRTSTCSVSACSTRAAS